MKKNYKLLLLGSFLVVTACNGNNKTKEQITSNKVNYHTSKLKRKSIGNLNLDKKTVIKLAEIILVEIYGERVLKQRPWIVTDNGNNFSINGTFNGKGFGGVAYITIRKSDGKVLHCIHDR